MNSNTQVIVLVLDRLQPSYIGPYGGSWVNTPSLNRLATESILVEHAIVDSPRIESIYQSYWRGVHACAHEASQDLPTLAEQLEQHCVATYLVTDEPQVVQQPCSEFFHECIQTESATPPQSAEHMDDTQLSSFMAQATEVLLSVPDTSLVWIHAQAMEGAWDTPYAMRCELADDEDPAPPDFVSPPQIAFADEPDPDLLLGITQAYAAEIEKLDQCLAGFLQALQALSNREIMFILTSPRGFPLGQHRLVGGQQALYGELIHVPYLMWFSDRRSAAERRQLIWQPPMLFATVLDFFGLDVPTSGYGACSVLTDLHGRPTPLMQQACSIEGLERSIRTPAWFYRKATKVQVATERTSGDASFGELFVKPDDRWEVNEIRDRRNDVAEQLCRALRDFEQAACDGKLDQLPPLDEELVVSAD